MKAACYTQGQGIAFDEVPAPGIGADEVLVRVQATAICGTDVKISRNGHRKLGPGQRIVLGHEFVGTTEAVGSAVTCLRPGQRVGVAPNWGCGRCGACIRGMANMCPDYCAFGINTDGSHASFVRIPAKPIEQGNVVELPPNVPWDEAALAEPLSCVLNAQRTVSVAAGDTVVVYGAGPMGLLHVLLAAGTGAAQVIVVDLDESRLLKARAAGASAMILSGRDPVPERVRAETQGRGADVAIVAAPVRALAEEALGLLAPFGRLCLFAGLSGDARVALDSNLIHYRNLVVTGTTGGAAVDYRAALRLIAARRVDVRSVISHRFPMAELRKAYATALAGQGLKVVITAE